MHFNVYDVFYYLNSHQHVSAAIAAILRVMLYKYKTTKRHVCILVIKNITLKMTTIADETCW